jgi:23S rRNA pseudouridine1911/1915/1917 synthase
MNCSKIEKLKTYWAIVKNKPLQPKAKLIHFIKRNEKKQHSKAYIKEVPDSKISLEYTVLKN